MHRTKRTKQKRDYSSSDIPKTCYWPLKKKKSKGIKKCLLFAEGVSQYIRASIVEWKNMRESIKRVLSGKDWRSTNLFSMPYQKGESIAKRIWAKLCLKLSMVKVKEVDLTLTFTWRWIYIKVLDLHQIVYTSDDYSTALMGKRYVRSTKKTMFEKKSLNYYLSNLYQELKIKGWTKEPLLQLFEG